MNLVKGLWARLQASRGWRAWQHYGAERGNVLAGGIAYFAFFSIFPAIAVGLTVFGLILGNNTGLQRQVVSYINDLVGQTVIGMTPADGGVVSIDQLVQSSTLSITGVIGLGTLLLTGLGWLDALRQGLRAIFEQPRASGNVVVRKLKDTGVLATLGLIVLASVSASVLSTTLTGQLLSLLGLSEVPGTQLLITAVTTVALLAVDVLLMLTFFRLLAGVSLPVRDLLVGAVLGGIGLEVLKLSSGLLVGSGGNSFLAAAGAVVVLLVAMNLIARLTLVAASVSAIVAVDRGHLVLVGEAARAADVHAGIPVEDRLAAGRTASGLVAEVPPTVRRRASELARPLPEVGLRSQDRVVVAAGAVLGMSAALVLGTVGRGLRAGWDAVRGS